MKNSVQSLTRETRRRRVAPCSRRKSKGKRRCEMCKEGRAGEQRIKVGVLR